MKGHSKEQKMSRIYVLPVRNEEKVDVSNALKPFPAVTQEGGKEMHICTHQLNLKI